MRYYPTIRNLSLAVIALTTAFSLTGCYDVKVEANVDKEGIISQASLTIQLQQSTVDIYNSQNPDAIIEMDEAKFQQGVEDIALQYESSKASKDFFDNCEYTKDAQTYKAYCPFKPTTQTTVIDLLNLDNPIYDTNGGIINISGTLPNKYEDLPSMMLNLLSYNVTLNFVSPVEYFSGTGVSLDLNDNKKVTVNYVEGANSLITIVVSPYVDYLFITIAIGVIVLLLLIVIALLVIRKRKQDAVIPRYIR